MIYIFISGYYDKYRSNLYQTLFLPVGYTNTYVFKHAGLTDILHKLNDQTYVKANAIIVFVDRYGHDGYIYYPIRKAVFQRYTIDASQERVTFYVKLEDYIFPHNCAEIQKDILRLGDIPQKNLDSSNPTDDGHYITISDKIIYSENDNTYYSGDDGWFNAVKELKNKKAFLAYSMEGNNLNQITNDNLENIVPFFFRIEFSRAKDPDDFETQKVYPKSKKYQEESNKTISFIPVGNGNECYAKIFFYFPDRKDTVDTKIFLKIIDNELNKLIIETEIPNKEYEKQRGELYIALPISRDGITVRFDIESNITSKVQTKEIVGFGGDIKFKFRRNYWKLFAMIVCILVYIVSSFCEQFITNYLVKLIVYGCQIISIIILTKLNGDKKLF